MKREAPGGAPIVHLNADPEPAGMICRWVTAPDGGRLRAAAAPAKGRARGSVLIAPGRTETVEKYFETMRDLAGRGFASFVIDHRGQGLSVRSVAGGRGHIDRFSQFGADFALAVGAFASDDLPRPWIGLGHSMGGLIMLELLLDRRLDLAGAILSAPMTGLALVTDLHLTAASVLSKLGQAKRFVPGGHLEPAPQFEDNEVTHDRGRYQRVLDRLAIAPELGLGDPTIGWTAAAHRAMRRTLKSGALRGLTTPLMILSAEKDTIVDNATHARIADMAPGATRLVIPGAAHEILTETDDVRQAFWAAFDAFVCGLGIADGAPAG